MSNRQFSAYSLRNRSTFVNETAPFSSQYGSGILHEDTLDMGDIEMNNACFGATD